MSFRSHHGKTIDLRSAVDFILAKKAWTSDFFQVLHDPYTLHWIVPTPVIVAPYERSVTSGRWNLRTYFFHLQDTRWEALGFSDWSRQ